MAKNPVVASSVKSLIRIALKTKSGELKPYSIRLSDITGTAIIPFVSSRKDLVEKLTWIFGDDGIDKFVQRYFIPKEFKYHDRFGSKERSINKKDMEEVYKEVSHYREFKFKPTFIVRGNKNCVFDYTDVLSKAILDVPESFWSHPQIVTRTESVILELFSKVVLGDLPEGLLDDFIFQNNLKFKQPDNILDNFDNVLIPISFEVTSRKFLEYLLPEIATPRIIRTNSKTIFSLTIARLIIALYTQDELDDTYGKFVSILNKKNLCFVFYTEKGSSIVIDLEELRKRKIKSKSFYQLFRTKLQTLIDENSGVIEFEDEDGEENVEEVGTEQSEDTDENRVANLIKSNPNLVKKANILNSTTPILSNIKTTKALSEDDDEEEDDTEISLEEGEIDTTDSDLDIIETTDDLIEVIAKNAKPTISKARQRRNELVKEKYKSIDIDGRSISEILNDVEALTIDNVKSKAVIRDDSLTGCNLKDFEDSYIKKTMEKDILMVANSFSENMSTNLNIIDVKKTNTSDNLTDKYTYVFIFEDENGKRHTMPVDIPKIDEDGFLKINGNKKILKKQLLPMPVVKFKPDQVNITTNFNKTQLFRQGRTLNREVLTTRRIIEQNLRDNSLAEISYGKNSKLNDDILTSIDYDELSDFLHRMVLGKGKNKVEFFFNQKELRDAIKKDVPTYKFKPGRLPFAIDYRDYSVMDISIDDKNGSVCTHIIQTIRELDIVPDLETLISNVHIPKRRVYTRMQVINNQVPLVVFLGALFGISEIINREKIKVTFSEKRLPDLEEDQVYIRFADGYLYYNEYPLAGAFILNGLGEMHTESISYADLEESTPYVEWLFDRFKTRNALKGWKGWKDLFLDPITVEVLRDHSLPTDFLDLFLYANSLLADNKYMPETDIKGYRVRGYEMISAHLYKAMSAQYQLFMQKSPKAPSMSIPQEEVMARLQGSFVLENYDSTNPVNELKTKAIVTFKGPSGINEKRAYTLSKRAYSQSMVGTFGLSSVDSDQVGVVKELTMNANLISTRGYIGDLPSDKDIKNMPLGKLATPEEADIAFVNRYDDPKRVGFASNQRKHVLSAKGASYPLISTGMDKASPSFVGHNFVPKAKEDGKILEVSDLGVILIQYKSGLTEMIETKKQLNRNSSFYLSNPLTVNVKAGQSVKKDDILAYNSEFYTNDPIGGIRATQAVIARLALHESYFTDEDSTLVVSDFSNNMKTDIIKRKQISLAASANIIRYKSIGEHVILGDPLVTFEDSSDQNTSIMLEQLGEIDEDTLDMLVRKAPKANETGIIHDIKVYWSVPISDMSDSCNKMVRTLTKELRAKQKLAKGNGALESAAVLDNMLKPTNANRGRINGAIMPEEGGVLIEYYILHENPLSVGDKISVYSSLKSVICEVVPKELAPVTEDGRKIQVVLGSISVQARQVNSIIIGGILGTIIDEMGLRISNDYINS